MIYKIERQENGRFAVMQGKKSISDDMTEATAKALVEILERQGAK